jgi:AcrR family transcriptional regulator
MKAPRPKSGASTRQSTLDAAMALFLRQGFHATSMRQIAAGAGVSLGAAYNHFPAKYDIFRCLVRERNPYIQIAQNLALAPEGPASERLGFAMRQIASALSQNANFIRLAMIDVLEFQGVTVGEAAALSAPTIAGFFRRLVDQGVASGEFRRAEPAILMRAVAGMSMSSTVLQTLAKPVGDLLPAGDWVSGYIELLLHGLMAEPAGLQVSETIAGDLDRATATKSEKNC